MKEEVKWIDDPSDVFATLEQCVGVEFEMYLLTRIPTNQCVHVWKSHPGGVEIMTSKGEIEMWYWDRIIDNQLELAVLIDD